MSTSKHVCPVKDCGKVFSKPSRLVIHIRTHTGEVIIFLMRNFSACQTANILIIVRFKPQILGVTV